MKINYENNDIIITGDKLDLLELSNYIKELALKEESHIHIDDLTLIDKESIIKNLIIEKKDK